MGKRLIVLTAYELISLITGMFYIQGGHGPIQPFYILVSWSLVIPRALLFNLPPDYGLALFLAFFYLYLLGLLFLNNLLRRIVRIPIPIIPLSIHGMGTVVGLHEFGKQGVYGSKGFLLAAWVVPLIIVCLYFTVEWRLASRAAAGRKNVDNGVPG